MRGIDQNVNVASATAARFLFTFSIFKGLSMKRFAILFAAMCMVAFVADDSYAQCGGGYYGGGFYGGGFRGVPHVVRHRPVVGFHYGNFRPVYNYGFRPVYHGNFYRGGGFYRHGGFYRPGISIRF